MSRSCTVCGHSERNAIERALIEGTANRAIARQYGLSTDAVRRHGQTHLPQSLAETVAVLSPAIQSHQSRQAIAQMSDSVDIMAEIKRHVARMNKLSDAADEWLTDPKNPDRYDIGPRANEITVVYEDYDDCDRHGNPRRKKASLSALLARISADGSVYAESAEARYADPRDVVLKSADGVKGHLQLLTTILDKLHSAEQAERFEAAVLTAIGEAAPDVRQRIEESLRHSNALRRLAGRPLG